jgi:hypothetical protein
MTMKKTALIPLLLAWSLAASAAGPAPRPGYGVVEAITPVRSAPASRSGPESASTGASAPAPRAALYRVRVRLDDGTIQVRTLRKPAFAAGDRVLLTNAGDVVPD